MRIFRLFLVYLCRFTPKIHNVSFAGLVDGLVQLMASCLNINRRARPSLPEVLATLDSLLSQEHGVVASDDDDDDDGLAAATQTATDGSSYDRENEAGLGLDA